MIATSHEAQGHTKQAFQAWTGTEKAVGWTT